MSRVYRYELLLQEAIEASDEAGWDLSFLDGRLIAERDFAWDFGTRAATLVQTASSLLDIGTGGGEFLAGLPNLPPSSYALESFGPNARVARDRLKAFGVIVLEVAPEIHEPDGVPSISRPRLPFGDAQFDVILARHAGFGAQEVARVLQPRGCLLTEQIGHLNMQELKAVFGRRPPAPYDCVPDIVSAGLTVDDARTETIVAHFHDIGAVVYYLSKVPWHVPDFDTVRHDRELRGLDERIAADGGIAVTLHRTLVMARKP
jgi:SAM-dependent methyltransferase